MNVPEGGRKIQYILRLTNLSNKVWSSKGIDGRSTASSFTATVF